MTTPPVQPVSAPARQLPSIGADEFRSFMAGFPTGVAVVTTVDGLAEPRGMTCSSVCSVTLTPPTLLVCVRVGSPTLDAMLLRGAFATNLLHEGARATAELFASGAPDRFARVRWRSEPGFGGPHLLDDAHAVADCRIVRSERMGDHIVVFGEVFRVEEQVQEQTRPLLYGLRQYLSTAR